MPSPSNNSSPRPRYCYCGCGELLGVNGLRFLAGHKPVGKARGPRDPEATKRAQARHRDRHPDNLAERLRKYAAANPEAAAASGERYRAKPEKRAARNARNRAYFARRRAVMDPREDLVAAYLMLERDPCAYCGGPGGTVDHIEPLADGGTHTVDNLAGACKRCNGGKCNRSLLEVLLNPTPQNNTLAVYTHPVQIARFTDELDHEHAIALQQQAARPSAA
jgi:5-methylcytosine-specific restriction endonuclease McrA